LCSVLRSRAQTRTSSPCSSRVGCESDPDREMG
jgi:hypothetical protein